MYVKVLDNITATLKGGGGGGEGGRNSLFSAIYSKVSHLILSKIVDSTVRNNDLTIEGFHPIFIKDLDRHGGGVAVHIRNKIKFLQREDIKTDFESLTVEIDIQYVKPILVATIYRPPDSLVEMFDKIDCLLCKLEFENKESIIVGDMNCNLMKEGDNDTKPIKHNFNSFGCTRLIENATGTTDILTLIDHFATTRPMNICDKGVILCGISDHDATFLLRSMRIPRSKKHPKIRKARKFQHFDNHLFLKDLEALNLDEIKNITKDPVKMWPLWRNLFLGVLDQHAPITEIKTRGSNLPYVTLEMRQLIRTIDHLKKKANQTGSKYIFQAYQQVRSKVSYGI